MTTLHVDPLTAAVGAEVGGVDLSSDLADPVVVEELRRAFTDHHVLVFRGQQLSRDDHKAFGRLFGELHIHPLQRSPKAVGDPEIFPVKADADTVLNNGGLWHADVTCDEVPPLGSMLYLTEGPPVGGDTLFANMHLAFGSLSEPVRTMLIGLTAVHDQRRDIARYGYEPLAGHDYPVSSHPVVVAHPDTGRPVLYVNDGFTTHIEGLAEHESAAVLALLFDHIRRSPAIQCRVRWAPGTLVFWDNRCVQHFAVWDYRPAVRSGDRVTIAAPTRPRAAGV